MNLQSLISTEIGRLRSQQLAIEHSRLARSPRPFTAAVVIRRADSMRQAMSAIIH